MSATTGEAAPQAAKEDSYIHLPGNLNEEKVYGFLDLAAKSDFYHDFHDPPKKKIEKESDKGTSVERFLNELSQSYDPMYEKAPYNLTKMKYTTAITDLKSKLVTINNTIFQMFEDNIHLTLPSTSLIQSAVSEEKVLTELFRGEKGEDYGNIQEKILNKLANTQILLPEGGKKLKIENGKLMGKIDGKGEEIHINLQNLIGNDKLQIQNRDYTINCFPVKIGEGENYINLPDSFKKVSGEEKKKYVLMIDASILSFTTITRLYEQFMDSKEDSDVEFYILSNMEGDSDPATKFASVDKIHTEKHEVSNKANVYFCKELVPEYTSIYASANINSASNRSVLYSNANLHTVRDPEPKSKKVNANILDDTGKGVLETDDLGSVSEINKACLEAMRKYVLVGKGEDIRKNRGKDSELKNILYHFMLKRAGDWCQALSLNDISRKYRCTNWDTKETKEKTLADLQAEGAEIALVTHDRILLAYALYNGLNVYYSGKRLSTVDKLDSKPVNVSWLLYFKNQETITVTDYPKEINNVKKSIRNALGLRESDLPITKGQIQTKRDLINTNYTTKINTFKRNIINNQNISSDPADPTNPNIIDTRYQTYIKELRLNTYRMANLLPAPTAEPPADPTILGDATLEDYKKWKAVEAYVLNLKNIEDNNSKESTPASWEAEYTESADTKEKKKHIITNLPSLKDSAVYKISGKAGQDEAFVLQATTDKAKSYGLLVSNIFPKIVEDLKIIQKNIGTIEPPVNLTDLIPTKNNNFGNEPTTGLARLRVAQNQVRFYEDIVKVIDDAVIPPPQQGGGTGDNKIKKTFMTRTMDTVPLTSIFYELKYNSNINTQANKRVRNRMIDTVEDWYMVIKIKSIILEKGYLLKSDLTDSDLLEKIRKVYHKNKNIIFKDKMLEYIISSLNESTKVIDPRTYIYSHIDRGVRLIDSNGQAFTVVDDIVFDSNLEDEMKEILTDLITNPTNYNQYPTTFLIYRSIIYYIDTIISRILSMYDNPQNTAPEMINKIVKEITDIEINPMDINTIIKNFIRMNKINEINGTLVYDIDTLYRRAQVQKLRFIFTYYSRLYKDGIAFKDNYYLKPLVDDFVFTYFYYSCRNLADVDHIEKEIKVGGKLASYNTDYSPPITDKKLLTENIKPVKLIYQVLEGKDISGTDKNALAQAIRFASSNAVANETVYKLLEEYNKPITPPDRVPPRNDTYDIKNKASIERYEKFIAQPLESTSQLKEEDNSDETKIEVTANAIRILQVMESIYKRKHDKLKAILGLEGILKSYTNNFRVINRTNTENTNKVKEEEEFCKEVNGGEEVKYVLKHLVDHQAEIEQPDENPELKEEKRNIYEEYDHYIRNFVDIITQFNKTSIEYYDTVTPGTVPSDTILKLPYEDNIMKTSYDTYETAYNNFLKEIGRIEQAHKDANKEVPVHEREFTNGGNENKYCAAKNAYIKARNDVIQAIMEYPQPPFNLSMELPESTNHKAHKGALTSIINVMKTPPLSYCRLYWYLKNIYVDLEDPEFETLFSVNSCTIPPTGTAGTGTTGTGTTEGGRRTRKQRKSHKGVKTRTAKPRKQSPRRHKKHPKKTRKH